MKTLTAEQNQTIANYKQLGVSIEIVAPDLIKVKQIALVNGFILNQKQLHTMARKIFTTEKITPVVYSPNLNDITIEWVKQQMEEYGVKRNDLVKQLGIDKKTLSNIFLRDYYLNKPMKISFFYYFLTYKLNNNLRTFDNE